MSIAVDSFSFLTLRPVISRGAELLTIESSPVLSRLGVGAFRTRAQVDTRARVVRIVHRPWWRSEGIFIDFASIECVVERFSVPTSFGLLSVWRGAYGSAESFSVRLVIIGGARETLARFRGEGTRATGLLGFALGDSLLDFQGTQEREAVLLAEEVAERVGARLAPHHFSPQPLGGFTNRPTSRDRSKPSGS